VDRPVFSRVLEVGAFFVVALLQTAPAIAQTSYTFDASSSSLEIDVYKEGLFSAFAHNHLVSAKEFSGKIQFDPNKIDNSSVTLRVAAKSLTVVDPGESAGDREQVQATMLGKEVLEVGRYAEISFQSTRVTQIQRQANGWRLTLVGTLQIRGAQRPIAFRLTVCVEGGELMAQGDAFILQSDYGIQPIKIAGGAVKVKNRLRIHFDIHAR
jgi:polyisoprenoid-binding protein YceI